MAGLAEDCPVRWPRDGRPRLIHFMPWDLTVGGAQRMLDQWCSLDAHRWDAHILTIGAGGSFAFAGATVHAELARSEVLSLIETLRPDLLVHHEPTINSGIISGCPQVWIVHCTNSLREAPATHVVPAAVFSNFDSTEIHTDWRRLPLHILPLGIDTRAFHPARKSHSGLVCGIVGRLHADKVPPSFIDAILSWESGPWRIRFVGHGLDTGYQRQVRSTLARVPWVEFSGDVPPRKMPFEMRRLDAVLIPTDPAQGETGSYTALEAMATGLPVIARDLAGLRHNCEGVPLYARDDSALLSHLRTLDDVNARMQARQRGRTFVVRKNGVHKHVAAHSSCFSAALRCEVSILMPVFDTPANYLAECWESIRSQTFRAWELVLVDDGSRAADTIAEIERIAEDPRVVLIRLNDNEGIPGALNVGLSRCRAELVARMDSDDKMMPRRLERQVEYLRSHPDVAILGTQMQGIEWETQRLLPPTRHPEVVTVEGIDHQRNNSDIWFLNHPTAMLRGSHVVKLGGYPSYRVAQDLGLWLTAIRAGLAIHNLPTVELHYRLHPAQTSTASGERRREYLRIVAELWDKCTTGRAESA